jgi:alpha-ribazole phosphatase
MRLARPRARFAPSALEAHALRLYLIRHPAPAIAAGICYGRLDVPTANEPTRDAARLRARLPRLDALYSSPLQRCRCLAELLHPAPQIDVRLQEMHFGSWEGQHWDTVPRLELDAWAQQVLDFTPPHGESARQMAARVLEFAAFLGDPPVSAAVTARATGNIAVVAHQGPLRVLTARLLGEGEERWLDRQFAYAAVTTLQRHPAGRQFVIAGHNE